MHVKIRIYIFFSFKIQYEQEQQSQGGLPERERVSPLKKEAFFARWKNCGGKSVVKKV